MMISAPAQQVENRYASSSSTVQQFSDPHEYQASVRGADLRLFLTAPGQYRARLTKIAMPRLWMQRGETSLPHVAHSVWSKGRSIILIHTGAQQAPMQHNGQEQSVGQILFGAL